MSELTRRLCGKRLACVMTNGHALQIRTHCGAEVTVAWVDDNGNPLKGKPVLAEYGLRLDARGINELTYLPGASRVPALLQQER